MRGGRESQGGGGAQGQRGGGAPSTRAGGEGQGGSAVEGCRGRCETEGAGAGGIKKKSEGRARGGSEWRPERQHPASIFFILFYSLVSLLTSWQVCPLCERDPEKPKQRACMKCAGLKERCEWPEVGGPGPVVDKGKGKAKEKEVATSPQGGKKRKKKKMAAKVADDDIVEVPGPSGKQSGFDPVPFLE